MPKVHGQALRDLNRTRRCRGYQKEKKKSVGNTRHGGISPIPQGHGAHLESAAAACLISVLAADHLWIPINLATSGRLRHSIPDYIGLHALDALSFAFSIFLHHEISTPRNLIIQPKNTRLQHKHLDQRSGLLFLYRSYHFGAAPVLLFPSLSEEFTGRTHAGGRWLCRMTSTALGFYRLATEFSYYGVLLLRSSRLGR